MLERMIYNVGCSDLRGVPMVKVGMAKNPSLRTKNDAFSKRLLLHTFEPVKTGKRCTDSVYHEWLDSRAQGMLYRPERTSAGRELYHIVDPELLALWNSTSHEDHQLQHGVFWSRLTREMQRLELEWKHDAIGCFTSYAMRSEQTACVAKALMWFERNFTSFLIAAKMRFGKTHVAYQIASKMGAKKVLIVSFATQAKSSWKDDLAHLAFAGSRYHDYKDGVPKLDPVDGMDVCFVSMQALTTGNIVERAWVFNTAWDFIILDEEHIGTTTIRSTEVLNRIKHKRELWVSGTAFRDITLGKFCDDNTFSWSYVDEQEAKAKELRNIGCNFNVRETNYQSLPNMNMRAIIPANEHRSMLNEVCEDAEKGIMPSLAKVFAAGENGQFKHPAQARAVVNMLEHELASGHFGDPRSLDHMLVYVPGVREATLIENLMKERPDFMGHTFINATGIGENDIEVAKQRAAGEKKTITLTCRRWCEAVTVPQWGTVVLFDEIRSPAQFWQTVFRAQGPFIDDRNTYHKRECYVIAFSLDVLLSQVYQLACFTRKPSEKLEDTFKRILDAVPVYGSYLTKLEEIGFEQAFKQGLKVSENIIGMFNGSSAIGSTNVSPELYKVLMSNVPKMDDIIARVEQALHSSGIPKGSVSKRSNPNRESIDDPAVRRANQLLCVLRNIERLIPRYLYASKANCRTLDEMLATLNPKWDARFTSYMGVSKQELKQLVQCGAFDTRSLDDKIAAFSTHEDVIRRSLCTR